MSSTICILPILAALSMADTTFLDPSGSWITPKALNHPQYILINNYWHRRNELSFLTADELKSRASRSVDEINQFLKENKFSIQLEKEADPEAWYIASIMNIMLEWSNPFTYETSIITDEKVYPAVHMQKKVYGAAAEQAHSFSIFADCRTINNIKDHSEDVIVALETKNKDRVYLTIADKHRADFDLLNHVMQLSAHLKSGSFSEVYYDELIFPMVEINEEPDISWLVGLRKYDKDNRRWMISQALQQTKFQMNEKGAAAQSGCAIVMIPECICLPESIYTIDKPFFLWIERPGMSLPLFAAYIDESLWKRPEKLGT